MIEQLVIPADIFREMVDQCRQAVPNEGCGFLAGVSGVVSHIYPLENAAASPVYYRPDGGQMLAALSDMDDKGIDLTAIFHSHVASPAFPSPTDVREAHHPDAAFVIVSLSKDEPEAKAYMILKQDWRDEEGQIEEIPLVISS